MALQPPIRLLEINIISAQDLPPVSKMLRTFVVAHVHPGHKLTTKINHHGHTNPTWNYKVAFHVDDRFIKHDPSAAVTFEIYNLAWLRDLPIGTARLLISSLSPQLHKNPSQRRVAVQICRPSGHLQGMLNLSVQLVDKTIPGGEMSLSRSPSVKNDVVTNEDEDEEGTERTVTNREESLFKIESICPTPATSGPKTEPDTRTIATSNGSHYSMMRETSNGSNYSMMRALPSEVAADLKRGFYATEWNEYGSSIFDGWTEQGDRDRVFEDYDHVVMRPKSPEWLPEEKIPLTMDEKAKPDHGWRHEKKKKKKKKQSGLFSCFGNAYGFEFSCIFGSPKKTKKNYKKKSRNVNKQNVHLMKLPETNLRRFHV